MLSERSQALGVGIHLLKSSKWGNINLSVTSQDSGSPWGIVIGNSDIFGGELGMFLYLNDFMGVFTWWKFINYDMSPFFCIYILYFTKKFTYTTTTNMPSWNGHFPERIQTDKITKWDDKLESDRCYGEK